MKGYPWWPAVVGSELRQVDKLGKSKDGRPELVVRFLIEFQ
jgi:hypothetical protein